jgi:hypothetical protein
MRHIQWCKWMTWNKVKVNQITIEGSDCAWLCQKIVLLKSNWLNIIIAYLSQSYILLLDEVQIYNQNQNQIQTQIQIQIQVQVQVQNENENWNQNQNHSYSISNIMPDRPKFSHTYLFTYSLTHLLTYSLTHWLTDSLTHSLNSIDLIAFIHLTHLNATCDLMKYAPETKSQLRSLNNIYIFFTHSASRSLINSIPLT